MLWTDPCMRMVSEDMRMEVKEEERRRAEVRRNRADKTTNIHGTRVLSYIILYTLIKWISRWLRLRELRYSHTEEGAGPELIYHMSG